MISDYEAEATELNATNNPIDDNTWNELTEMVEDGIMDLIEAFFESAPPLLEQMAEASANQNADSLRHASHTLKSSAANMGALYLSELCKTIEYQARSGDITESAHYIALAEAEYERVQTAIAAKFD